MSTVTELLDNYAKADRKARNSERHKLISKLDALESRARHTRRGSPQRAALTAQADRIRKQLQVLLQQREEARARQREQQRWRREMGDSRALFDTVRADKQINLPLDKLRVPTHTMVSMGKGCSNTGSWQAKARWRTRPQQIGRACSTSSRSGSVLRLVGLPLALLPCFDFDF